MAKALTVAAVEKLKPDPTKRLEVPDGLLTGLYLVIQTSGAKSWAVRYRAHGKPKKLTLGGYPAIDLTAAREAARKALEAVQRGEDPAHAKQVDRATADIRQFDTVVRKYVTHYAHAGQRTWQGKARLLGLAVGAKQDDPQGAAAIPGSALSMWGHWPIDKIKRAEIRGHLRAIKERGAGVHANRTLAALRHLFNWAIGEDLLSDNPCENIPLLVDEEDRDRVLTDDEVRALWSACEGVGWPFGPVVKLLLLTGQRRDEVAEMRWRELDLDNALWTIPRERAKNKKAHTVQLSAPVLTILKSVKRVTLSDGAKSDYVFTTTGTTPVSGFSRAKTALDAKMLAALRKQALEKEADPDSITVPDWRLHDLRRTFATGAARAKIDVVVVDKILNHTPGKLKGAAKVYQHHDFMDERKQALDTWAQTVLEITGEKRPLTKPQLRVV